MKEKENKLQRYLGENGFNLLTEKHPTPDKIEQLKNYQNQANTITEFIRAAKSSRDKAKELLDLAYEKGTFDEIIKHLEEARELAKDYGKTKIKTFEETMNNMKGITYIAGIDPISDDSKVVVFKKL